MLLEDTLQALHPFPAAHSYLAAQLAVEIVD
jgi:hypothetical protein